VVNTQCAEFPHDNRAMKTILITGASRGIGAATARLCVQRGFAVAVNYASNVAAADEVVAAALACGVPALALQADVSNEAQVLAMFARIDAELPPLAGLVNNAGVVDVASRLEDQQFARWQRLFEVNVFGSFLCAREAVKRMSTRHAHGFKGQGGCIVNMSSAAARLGSPNIYVDYAASKGAIDTFTLGLAREVAAEGIRVNAVRPGVIDTDIHSLSGMADLALSQASLLPIRRLGTAEEVANAVLWLLSDEASYTHGALLDVAGGR
jgi:NAD(P)-dependent dehydrogenase (short-subunit alcohol dehydrogenase family)